MEAEVVMDTVSKKKRTEIMRAIRGRGSRMEVALQRELRRRGFSYKKNFSRLPGKPDIAFPRENLVVFLDSCFWHGCQKHCRFPASNRNYWLNKIERNKQRDKEVNKKCKSMGLRIRRFWEHEVKEDVNKVVSRIARVLH